jgi:hypothetical protein
MDHRDDGPDDVGSTHVRNVISFYLTTWRNIPEDSRLLCEICYVMTTVFVVVV